MNIKDILIYLGAALAILLYFPLVKGIIRDEIEQSFATWALWVSLDSIALFSVIMQHGNWVILACYVAGGTTVTITLVMKKQFTWTWFEWVILFMVIGCLAVWYMTGHRWATICSSIAVFFAGAPQFKDSWKKPDRDTAWIYVGYTVANALSFWGGKTWTVEDRFYPGLMVPLCAAIAFAAFRKPVSRSTSRVHN